MINVITIDDHAMLRDSIRLMLDQCEDINPAAEADSAETALKLLTRGSYDVALVDVHMPGSNGFDLCKNLALNYPDIKIVGLSGRDDGSYGQLFKEAGALGYVTKKEGLGEIAKAIRAVHDGGSYVSNAITRQLGVEQQSEQSDKATRGQQANPFDQLAKRELQVAKLLAQSYLVVEISKELGIGYKTVKTYRKRVRQKLDIFTDVELTLLAIKHGLIDPSNKPD